MIQVLITSYNRPDALRELLWDLNNQDTGMKFAVHVHFDNRSTTTYKPDKYKLTQSNQLHKGKKGYWETINKAWSHINRKSKYIIQIPDDVRVSPDFITNAVNQWEAIENPKKICLNLRLDRSRIGKPCWTKRVPTIEGNAFRVGWVDMCYISGIEFFNFLGWAINPIMLSRWSNNPRHSSGVGLQISQRMDRAKKAMYQVRNTILKEAHLPSQMNKAANIGVKKSEYNLPPLIAGMATMPGREKQVVKAIGSILPQVDRLYLWVNNDEGIKDFDGLVERLKNPKTYIASSKSNDGDSVKFFGNYANPEPHYYFSLDDDIIYPQGYIWKLWQYMDKWGNRPAVGIHGRVMKQGPIRSYYHGGTEKMFHCRHALDKARRAHVLGTGTLGFYSETIKLSPEDFPLDLPNMADIHFAKVAQRLGVPCISLPRPEGYIKVQDLKPGTTIYEQHHRSDRKQTRLANSIKWKLHGL